MTGSDRRPDGGHETGVSTPALDRAGEDGFAAVLATTDLSIALLVTALGAWIAMPVVLAAILIGPRSA